jgi:UDP-glucose 4-epimerase
MNASTKLLITGGRGRLGRLIAEQLRFSTCVKPALFSRSAGEGLLQIDQLFRPSTLGNGGVLLHLAWSSLPATAEQKPELSENEDLPLIRKLLDAMLAIPIGLRPHLVFFSSGGAVYGNAPGRPSHEGDCCRPISAYGRAKHSAEKMIEEWGRVWGCKYTILRISNPYGYPLPEERKQGIISHAIRAAFSGKPLRIWGDGSARKDFLYYSDFIAALGKVIDQRPVGTFNLCFGYSHTLNEVLEEVRRQTGRSLSCEYSPSMYWDVQDSQLSNGVLGAVLQWSPKVSLQEGIRRSIRDR